VKNWALCRYFNSPAYVVSISAAVILAFPGRAGFLIRDFPL
jgi:hypothetical protein